MTYEDQVAIGSNLNDAISRALTEQLGPEYDRRSDLIADAGSLIAAIAQAVLVQLDQANYKIEKK
jgi:hypothetical protein